VIYLTKRFEYTISDRSFSESETKKIFADAGIDWPTRAERYEQLKGTIFQEVDGEWWISYLDGKPVGSYGIAKFEGVYLSLGARSYSAGAGEFASRYVVNKHGDKPILANGATQDGVKLLNKLKFKPIEVKNGLVQGNTDIPTEVKSALEVAKERGGTIVRKIYLKNSDTWFVLLRN
tara:strand:+ start:3452 stop:3982 length:531 start_codon:yes stop_codon:yes gene_type:complete